MTNTVVQKRFMPAVVAGDAEGKKKKKLRDINFFLTALLWEGCFHLPALKHNSHTIKLTHVKCTV